MNVNQGDDTQLGGSWTSTVGTTFDASDLLRQRLEGAFLDPGSLGGRGVAAGVGDLDLHCCRAWFVTEKRKFDLLS